MTTATVTTVHRHPIVGFSFGLLLGLGLAILLFLYGVVPITAMWLGALLAGGILLGIALAYLVPVRHSHSPA